MREHTPEALAAAKELRRKLTMPEILLWQRLRGRSVMRCATRSWRYWVFSFCGFGLPKFWLMSKLLPIASCNIAPLLPLRPACSGPPPPAGEEFGARELLRLP